MGVIDDVVRSIGTKIDKALEQWLRISPAVVTSTSPFLVKVDGSTVAIAGSIFDSQQISVGDAGYVFFHPGRVAPIFFKVTSASMLLDVPTTSLPLASGTTGTVNYAVVQGAVQIDVVTTTFASATAGTARTLVAAGGIPAAYRPAAVKRALFTNSTIIGRLDVGSDGSITATPLTGTTTGALGTMSYLAGK